MTGYKRVAVRTRITRANGQGLYCYSCDYTVPEEADACRVCKGVVFYRGSKMSRVPFVSPHPPEVDDLPAIPARRRNDFLGRKRYAE